MCLLLASEAQNPGLTGPHNQLRSLARAAGRLAWAFYQKIKIKKKKLREKEKQAKENNKGMYLGLYTHWNFFFKHLYWSIIALHCCVSCCCITVNQLYVYIYPHIPSLLHLPPTLPIPPSRWSQSTELISLCYAAASH